MRKAVSHVLEVKEFLRKERMFPDTGTRTLQVLHRKKKCIVVCAHLQAINCPVMSGFNKWREVGRAKA